MNLTTSFLHQALYRLFAWLLLYPDQERLNTLRAGAAELLECRSLWGNESYAEPLSLVLKKLACLDDQDGEALASENSRLFAVRPLAPPYESLYTAPSTEGRGWVSAQLERLYGRYGLAINSLNELPDHLAVELEFLSYLCEQEATAMQTGDTQGAQAYHQAQADFLDRHLRKWLGAFCSKVQAAAPAGFYADVVEALAAVAITGIHER